MVMCLIHDDKRTPQADYIDQRLLPAQFRRNLCEVRHQGPVLTVDAQTFGRLSLEALHRCDDDRRGSI